MQGPALLHGETISRIIRKPETTSYIINIWLINIAVNVMQNVPVYGVGTFNY